METSSVEREDIPPIPVFSAMTWQRPYYLNTLRTTICDIMCTTNSALPELNKPPPPPSERPLMATLPYQKAAHAIPLDKKTTTLFQRYKLDESKGRKASDLRRERDDYFRKLLADKFEREEKMRWAAVKIQAIFRGFRARPRNYSYIPKRKRKKVLSQTELHDELCEMAGKLSLPPIPGLSLESRMKASRRKLRIENAAAFRIQRFFRMITQKRMALIVVKTRKMDLINRSAKVITRAIRFMKTRNFIKRAETVKKGRCAIVIQSHYRKWRAQQRVRELRKQKFRFHVQSEAAIIIQRNFGSRHRENLSLARATLLTIRSCKRMYRITFEEISRRLLEEFIDVELNSYIPKYTAYLDGAVSGTENLVVDEVMDALWMEASEEFILALLLAMEEERRRVEEARRQVEESLAMAQEEDAMRRYLADKEARLRDEKLARERHERYLVDETIQRIQTNFFNHEVTRMVADYAQQKYQEELLRAHEEKVRIEQIRRQAFTHFVKDCAEQLIVVAFDHVVNAQVYHRSREEIIQHLAEKIADDAIFAAISICSDSYSAYARELAQLDQSTTASIPAQIADVESAPSALLASISESYFEDSRPSAVSTTDGEEEDDDERTPRESVQQTLAEDSTSDREDEEISITPGDQRHEVVNHVKDTAELFVRGKYEDAIAALDPMIAELTALRDHHLQSDQAVSTTGKGVKFRILLSVSRLLKARALHALSMYEESKAILDSVLNDRESVLGKMHYLVAEVHLYLAEWHRSVGQSLEAEQHLKIADDILTDELNIPNSEDDVSQRSSDDGIPKSKTVSSTFFKLFHRVKVARCELLRQSGQYLQCQKELRAVQKSLTRYKLLGLISFEVQEEFHVCFIHMLILRQKWGHALALHKELLEKRRGHYGAQHIKVASSLEQLGRLYLLRAEYGEAAKCLEESMALRYEFYPPDHPAIAAAHLAKAEAFTALGRADEAYIEATRALQLFHQKLASYNGFHPVVARSLFMLSQIHSQLGEPILVEQAAGDAVKIYAALHGITDQHRRSIDSLEMVADAAVLRRNFTQARDLLSQALARREVLQRLLLAPALGKQGTTSPVSEELQSSSGKDPTATNTMVLLEIAVAQFRLQYLQALTSPTPASIMEEMKESIKQISLVVGNRHALIAQCLLQLSEICKLKGCHGDAKSFIGFAFDIVSGLHGEEHPLIPRILAECADNLRIPGFFDEAQSLCESAIQLFQRVYQSPQNTHIAQGLLILGQIYSDQNKFAQAEDTLLHAINMTLAKAGEDCALYTVLVGQLAELDRRRKHVGRAERNFVYALQAGQRHCGLQSLAFLEMAMHYSLLLMDMRQWLQAYEILYSDILPVLTASIGAGHLWSLFVRVNAVICLQMQEFAALPRSAIAKARAAASDSEQSQLLPSEDSLTEDSILSQTLAQHPDVRHFFDIWQQAGFSTNHPWYRRLSQVTEILPDLDLASESQQMQADGGMSVGFSIHSYPSRPGRDRDHRTTASSSHPDSQEGSYGEGTYESSTYRSENDSWSPDNSSDYSPQSRSVTQSSSVQRDDTSSVFRSLVSGSEVSGHGGLTAEPSQYSAAMSTVLSVPSLPQLGHGAISPRSQWSEALVRENDSTGALTPLRDESVSVASNKPSSLESGAPAVLRREKSTLSYHSHMSRRGSGSMTPRSAASGTGSLLRTPNETPRSVGSAKSSLISVTPSTVRSRLANLEGSQTSTALTPSIETSSQERGSSNSHYVSQSPRDYGSLESSSLVRDRGDSLTDYLSQQSPDHSLSVDSPSNWSGDHRRDHDDHHTYDQSFEGSTYASDTIASARSRDTRSLQDDDSRFDRRDDDHRDDLSVDSQDHH